MLQCVPFPTCWLLRDWKHLFIILCIISTSIILITSFPQDSSKMGLSYNHWKLSNVRKLIAIPQHFACFSQAATTSSFPLFSLIQSTHYYQRRMVIRKHPHGLQWLRVCYWTFGVYIEADICLFVCLFSAVNIKRLVFQTMFKVLDFISFLDGWWGQNPARLVRNQNYYHVPSSALRRLLFSSWIEW